MPICPRCGKCLSSDQALTYHLNRKYKCGTWKCNKCNDIFGTKFQLQMHEMNCLCDNECITPGVDFLIDLYNNLPFVVMHVDSKDIIKNVSPNIKQLLNMEIKDLKNHNIKTLVLNRDVYLQKIPTSNHEFIIFVNSNYN